MGDDDIADVVDVASTPAGAASAPHSAHPEDDDSASDHDDEPAAGPRGPHGEDTEMDSTPAEFTLQMYLAAEAQPGYVNDAVATFRLGHPIYAVGLHPAEPVLVTGAGDDHVYLWHTQETEQPGATFEKAQDTPVGAAFNADGTLLASASMDGKLCIRQFPMVENEMAPLDTGSEITWMSWHPTQDSVLLGTEEGMLWVATPHDDAFDSYYMASASALCGGWTPDGKATFSGHADGSVAYRMADAYTTTWCVQLPSLDEPSDDEDDDADDDEEDAPNAAAKHGAMDVDGAAASADGTQDDDEAVAAAPEKPMYAGNAVTAAAVCPDHPYVVVGCASGTCFVLRRDNGRVLKRLDEHTQSVEGIVVHSTRAGLTVVTVSVDGRAVVWNALQDWSVRHVCRHVLEEGDGVELAAITGVRAVPTTPPRFITTAVDGAVRLWDSLSGTLLRTWRGHLAPVLSLDVHAGHKTVITGSDDGTARLFQWS